MKNKLKILIYILAGTLSFSANTSFEIWKNNFNAKVVAHSNFYPWVGGGLTADIDYKIFRNNDKNIYFLMGGGFSINGYSIENKPSINGAIYSDMRIKGQLMTGLHMYAGGRFGLGIHGKDSKNIRIKGENYTKTTPEMYGGGYVGMEYNNFILEVGSNTTNLLYLGIGGSF